MTNFIPDLKLTPEEEESLESFMLPEEKEKAKELVQNLIADLQAAHNKSDAYKAIYIAQGIKGNELYPFEKYGYEHLEAAYDSTTLHEILDRLYKTRVRIFDNIENN